MRGSESESESESEREREREREREMDRVLSARGRVHVKRSGKEACHELTTSHRWQRRTRKRESDVCLSSSSSLASLSYFYSRRQCCGGGLVRSGQPRASVRCLASLSPSFSLFCSDKWGVSSLLAVAATLGMYSERTAVGRALSGPLVSTLIALGFSNIGLINNSNYSSITSSVYSTVYGVLLPVALPMLLFTADMRRVLSKTGPLLFAYIIASVATVIATLIALKLCYVPLTAQLGGETTWKIAAALLARHIGSAVNYVAVNEALQTEAAVQSAGLAADNVVCAMYFAALFALARRLPTEKDDKDDKYYVDDDNNNPVKGDNDDSLSSSFSIDSFMKRCASSLTISLLIVKFGIILMGLLKVPRGYLLPTITLITVFLSTAFPSFFSKLSSAGESSAKILMHVFFATVGAEASLARVITTAPQLFIFCFLQVFIHLFFVVIIAKLFSRTSSSIISFPCSARELLLASNAAVGGPTTASGNQVNSLHLVCKYHVLIFITNLTCLFIFLCR